MLPEAFAMEVIMRMLRMESVQKDVLDDVERVLRNEFMSNLARTARPRRARDDRRDLQQPRPRV
jgi:flagellar motor switch protein FliG